MNYSERLKYYNLLKEAHKKYDERGKIYTETAALFNQLLEKIESDLVFDKSSLEANSTSMCEKFMKQNLGNKLANIHFNRFLESDLNNLVGVISNYINFDAPTLELFPGEGQFLPFAVGAEPLYIADTFSEVCELASKVLQNDFYITRRLRKYKIDPFDLSRLPSNVFDLIYCFNEFFFVDIDYIYKYSKEVFTLLHSGGKYIFNFMPIDQDWAIENTNVLRHTVIDYEKLMKMMQKDGWIIHSCKIQYFKSSHIIAIKPGELQPRAKLSGSVAEIIDLPPEKV